MFFNSSRYLRVKEVTAVDCNNNNVKVKRVRQLQSLKGDFIYQVKAGDRLDLLAYKFYRTPRKWWLICDANPRFMYPDELLEPGLLLFIPNDKGTL